MEEQLPRVDNNNNNNDIRPSRVNNNINNNVQPVNNNPNNNVRPPKVLRQRATIHQQKYAQGTRIYRIFGEPNRLVEHRGYICDFDKKEGYYKVKYQDGATEDETETMLHKTKRNINILQALSATNHERIIEEYTTMETIYTPPSQFSGKFAKAMKCVEMIALEAVNMGFDTVGDQVYKWANIVIDKETGDVMDLKKLLNHPKYTETWTRAAANEYG